MSDADKAFAGSIPEYYDTYMVPLIFEAYAEDMAARVASVLRPFLFEPCEANAANGRIKW
jgi:hypothetical protein